MQVKCWWWPPVASSSSKSSAVGMLRAPRLILVSSRPRGLRLSFPRRADVIQLRLYLEVFQHNLTRTGEIYTNSTKLPHAF